MAAQIDVGGGYSIDIDDAQKFVTALTQQKQELALTLQRAARVLQVLPPGHDDYSSAWASTANQMVKQHSEWNLNKQKELQALIDKVNAVVAQYQQTEHDNTLRA
ncbi:PE domain-containing protein [Kutzneria sp. NPDC052558]|uniref:PE domain-containing protein n=1 Tax=Kutzneria sp. NPDC052558 TaxID=3364121 RepID=UPI0037CA3238